MNIIKNTYIIRNNNIMEYIILIVILIMFICGIIFITISLTKINNKCPKAEIIYKYLPKKYLDQQYNENMASDIFQNMFTMSSPWIADSVYYRDTSKTENINKYFVSQI